MGEKFDFSGWATRNNLKCSDGRTIRKDAFKDNNGQTVPLVWQHTHDDPMNVLGHALLENREDGVYAYGKFNETASGQNAKQLVRNGDITALSIYANQLQQNGGDVLHGSIREVSLVLSGANPGAYIEYPILEHSDYEEDDIDCAIIKFVDNEPLIHADMEKKEEPKKEVKNEENKEEEEEKMAKEDKTVKDVFDELTEEQKNVVYFMIGQALEDAGVNMEDEEGEVEEDMKHNVFESDYEENYLSHSDMERIFSDAKKLGSLKDAVAEHTENGVLMHATPTEGMTTPSGSQNYGFRDPDMLFPEFKTLNNPPEWIKRDMDWVSKVINGAHHTPFSRIKSVFADITEDEARARGYIKGKLKKEEVFTLLKRTTDPQTVYKKQKMDRDDIVDIVDFDVVAWIKAEMRMMLEEEIARAVLIGDGRLSSSDDKIQEAHVRPIVSDSPLFTIPVEVNSGSDNTEMAKNFINECIRARKSYKGSGTPSLFTTAEMHTEMLLLEDQIGHKLYKSDAELATALRVSEIVEVAPMEGTKVNEKDLLGVIVNMTDYNIGADKGGEVNLFDDFDIDYNQYKYLIETRVSGALIKPFSAIALTASARG